MSRIRGANSRLDEVQAALLRVKLPRLDGWNERCRQLASRVHYPVPVHLQEAYRELGRGRASLPVTERLAGSVLSLPLYSEMTASEVEEVATALGDWTDAVA